MKMGRRSITGRFQRSHHRPAIRAPRPRAHSPQGLRRGCADRHAFGWGQEYGCAGPSQHRAAADWLRTCRATAFLDEFRLWLNLCGVVTLRAGTVSAPPKKPKDDAHSASGTPGVSSDAASLHGGSASSMPTPSTKSGAGCNDSSGAASTTRLPIGPSPPWSPTAPPDGPPATSPSGSRDGQEKAVPNPE